MPEVNCGLNFKKLEPVVVRELSKPTLKFVPVEKPWP